MPNIRQTKGAMSCKKLGLRQGSPVGDGKTTMRTYTFYFADRFSPVQSFDILECEDDEEARRRAAELLGREPERLAVEVWSGAEQVFAFDRERPRSHAG